MIARRLIPALVIGVALGTSACADPDIMDGILMGLDEVNAQLEWENRNCYYAKPPGNPYGIEQRYCPGDLNYHPPVYVAPDYDRDHDRQDRRDRRRHRDHDRDRDRDHDRDRDRDRDRDD